MKSLYKINYDSIFKNYANRSFEWLRPDSNIAYNQNFIENYSLLEENGWINYPSFTYDFNSHGFRCSDFTNEKTIMFLGCSITMGLGLPNQYIWPSLVSNSLGMRSANLGINAGSCDTAFRLCHGWIDVIKPSIVIFLSNPGIRLELVNNRVIRNVLTIQESSDRFISEWIVDENNNELNKLKNTMAIQHMCDSRGIKFLPLTSEDFNEVCTINDKARDLKHPGVKCNQQFADYIVSNI
jgi:hypothetical protein